MSDLSKRSPPKPSINRINALVSSNVKSNNRNHRSQIQPPLNDTNEFRNNSFQEQNGKSASTTPKPLLDCLQPGPLLTSKPFEKSMSQRRRRNKPFDQENLARSNDDQVDKPNISPGKIEMGRSTIDIREPTDEHKLALRNAFNKILTDRSLSDKSREQRQIVFTKLRQLIVIAHPDSQINLYGSILFECCLEKPGVMDIDIQMKETLQYDTLKELLDLIKKSDLCKEAEIDTENKPSCISLIINEPNMRVKITSGYNRGINLSKLIRTYMKFDSRVIKLLRLFRILAKSCNIDKPDLGTLHPMVFHLMVIHFLQQLIQPVLPCLHEYAYGIDQVPITLNENQYPEFFKVCQDYSRVWKSKNTTNIEMLLLQLLSYYIKTFNTKQFVVSIQTRMPVMKADKNWYSRKLLVEDPTDVKRNLCQTMQSIRSVDYFRDTLNTALNYFGRKQKKVKKPFSNECSNENSSDDLIEIVVEDENEIPTIEPSNSLHNSYKLFYKCLPPTVARDVNIRQGRVRTYYKQTFDNKYNFLPNGVIRLNSSQDNFDNSDQNEIQEAFQHDLENNFETMDENDDEQNVDHAHLLQRSESNPEEDEEQSFNENLQQIDIDPKETASRELFPINDEEPQSIENDPSTIINDTETLNDNDTDQNNIDLYNLMEKLNEKQRLVLQSEYQQRGNTINDKVKELYENLKSSTDETTTINVIQSSESDKTEINTIKSSSPINIEKTSDNNPLPSPFTSPIKLEQIIEIKKDSPTENSTDLFYDFQAENFHAEQGAPYVCTTCNGVGHLKSECPELIVPNMIALPAISEDWIKILSRLCRQITDRCKPTSTDIENRGTILKQLEKQFQKDYPECNLHAFGSFYNGFGFRQSDLDVCIVFKDEREQTNDEVLRIMHRLLKAMKNSETFENVQSVLHAKVPIIRSRHRRLHIEIDISLHNMLAIENTQLLKTYTEIDSRVSELGYMIKHLAKSCGIGDASRGTLSSYAYIIMIIHFLQQVQPPVLPVLQQLSDDSTKKSSMYKKCSKWNVYFYKNVSKIKEIWKNGNKISTGALWIEFLRYFTEQFNYEEHVVSIKQIEPLLRHEKGWFRQTLAIEDPFELSHNLAGGLSIRNWTIIRRVFIRARQQFCIQLPDIDISDPDMTAIEDVLFNVDELCPTNAPKRCEWCKGPYHIRKRCPKLAALANENDKRRRNIDNSDQQQSWTTDNSSGFYSNNFREHSNFSPNVYDQQYYNGNDYYTYGHASNRNTSKYANDGPRVFNNSHYYSNDQQTTNFRRPYHSNNNNNNNNQKLCYACGSPDHIRSKCTKPNGVQRQKSSS